MQLQEKTRMHFSRMRNVCSSSGLPAGGGGSAFGPRGLSAFGPGGCLLLVPGVGVGDGGVYLTMHWGRYPLL